MLEVNDPFVPRINASLQPSFDQTVQDTDKEYKWLETAKEPIEKETLAKEDAVSAGQYTMQPNKLARMIMILQSLPCFICLQKTHTLLL